MVKERDEAQRTLDHAREQCSSANERADRLQREVDNLRETYVNKPKPSPEGGTRFDQLEVDQD